MSKTTLAWALALSTAIATPALAQSDSTTKSGDMVKQPDQTTTAAPAGTMGTAGGFITQAQMGQYRASKLAGVDIYNNNDENIGEVNELIVDGSGKVLAVVIGVGGFLGIGEKNVALPFDQVKWMDTPRQTAANTNPPAATGTGAPVATGTGAAAPGTPDTTGAVATQMHRDYPDHGMVNMSKDQLKNAPEFKYFSEAK
jgi:sporulation protein YlmC with PRC-barrel domain